MKRAVLALGLLVAAWDLAVALAWRDWCRRQDWRLGL